MTPPLCSGSAPVHGCRLRLLTAATLPPPPQDLPPTSVALLLVSVSAEMQQQLLAEATALGIVRKIRLLLALQSVNK